MFGPPALPSQPPPPKEADTSRPMSFFGAALWVTLATLAFMWLAALLVSIREATMTDHVVLVVAQGCAYLLVLFGILRVHAPEQSIREVVGLRATHPGFYPLSFVLGAASAVPATWLLMRIEQRFPSDAARAHEFSELFYEASMGRRVAMAVAIVVVGPIVEELLFRGAIFGPLARRQRAGAVVAMTAVYFAFVHPEPRSMPPIFLVGLLLGFMRAASGSLVPAILLHAGFNFVPFIELFGAPEPARNGEDEAIPAAVLFAGTAVTAVALAASVLLANKSSVAQAARQREERDPRGDDER